ncbi:MAG: VCBS repeat-containing protein, partial [Gemmatimonadetes bacterium]|nr:VCBS repeat-containing protein [Gemmatimonadota bacterium]
RNDGNFTFTDLLIGGIDDAGAAFSSAWGDYDDDGDPDLYLVNSGSSNKLFRNDGGGSFADVTVAPLNLTVAGRSAVWGDYDNDEDLDLFVVNQSFSDKLFRNDGGVFVDVTPLILSDAGSGSEGRFADWDNDGDLDIYLVKFAQPNVLYRNDGSNGWAIKNTGQVEEDGLGNAFAWGDFDGDGGIDMYVGNDDDNLLFRNEQAYANAWLHVDLAGTVSNRSGIGARITVEENGKRQMREVTGGDGRGGFDSITAEFGFGPGGVDRTGVDLVEVRWPSGIVQTLTNVAAYQRITIVETDPTPAPEVAAAGPADALTLTAAPNPSLARTTLRFTMPRDGATDLRIYDAAGRLVRVLDRRQRAAAAHAVRWDGDDTQGRSVAPGVYFARLECAGEHAVQRIVRIAR